MRFIERNGVVMLRIGAEKVGLKRVSNGRKEAQKAEGEDTNMTPC